MCHAVWHAVYYLYRNSHILRAALRIWTLRTQRSCFKLAHVKPLWSLQLHCSWKLSLHNCLLWYWRPARLRYRTSAPLHFAMPTGRQISTFNISTHQLAYADDTQLYKSVDSTSSAEITRRPSCAGIGLYQMVSWELYAAKSVKDRVTGIRQQVTELMNASAVPGVFLLSSLEPVFFDLIKFGFFVSPLISIDLLTFMLLK